MTAPVNIGFEEGARALSDDEHYELSRHLEVMRENPCDYDWQSIHWWKRDHNWHDDPAEYFAANRNHFLERARDEFAEAV